MIKKSTDRLRHIKKTLCVCPTASAHRGKKKEANCEPQHTAACCCNWVSLLRKDRLKVVENRELRETFGSKMEKVTRERIKTA